MLEIFLFFTLLTKHVVCSWGAGMVKEIHNQTQRVQIFTPQNVWVKFSFFQNIIERDDNGGAVLMKTDSNYSCLLIEQTSFHNCVSYQTGGSIFQSIGNFILNSVCNSNSLTELHNDGEFIHSVSTNTYDNFQEIEYCSVNSNINTDYAHCIFGPILLEHGCISIKSLNLSQEKYIVMALFRLRPYSDYSYHSLQYS